MLHKIDCNLILAAKPRCRSLSPRGAATASEGERLGLCPQLRSSNGWTDGQLLGVLLQQRSAGISSFKKEPKYGQELC